MRSSIETSNSKKKIVLIIPLIIMLTVYLVVSLLIDKFGMIGLLYGYIFYWVFWCLLFPIWTLGWEGFKKMFAAPTKSIAKFEWLLIVLPIAIYAGYSLPEIWSQINLSLVLLSMPVSLVNGTLEEVFWRGTFISLFPKNRFLGFLYPSIAFGAWHAAPYAAVFGFEATAIAGVIGGGIFGLCWGWISWKTGSIRFAVLSHVLSNFVSMAALNFMW